MSAEEQHASVSIDPGRPRIERAERFSGGVIIEFSDDTCALYSAGFLYDSLGQAERIITGSED
jgi:hypothetical protein